ncbi:hypothetical protein IC582_019772 [Cucumis melo]
MNEQQKPIKRRKLCKIADKKVSDQQVNPPTTSTEVILKPTILVPDVKLQDVDSYDPVWKAYLSWKRSRKTTNEERTVVFTTIKKEFFKELEENTWILGDTTDLLLYHVLMLHINHLCKYTFTVLDSSFMIGINKEHCIVRQRLFDNHVLTADNKEVKWTDTTTCLTLWTEAGLDYYFNLAVGDIQHKVGWENVNYVIGCINIKEHWLAVAAHMKTCKIYVFDSMPKYVEKELVDATLEILARCIPSLTIAIEIHAHRKHFTYVPWPVVRSNTTLQKGTSLDCRIFCAKFIECLITNADRDCLIMDNMKLFRQQYVVEFWTNKLYW